MKAHSNERVNVRVNLRRVLVALGALTGLCAAPGAHATNADVLAIDLATMSQSIAFNWASNPSPATQTQVALSFSPTTRTAYTQAAPLQLPCDVNQLSVGMSFRNISGQALYPEMSGTVAINGAEGNLITNVYGQTEPHAPSQLFVQPGTVGTGGFIFIALPPLYDYTTEQFPANVPLKIRMRVAGFTSTDYDVYRGGFYLNNQIAESVIWNNAYAIWVKRVCP